MDMQGFTAVLAGTEFELKLAVEVRLADYDIRRAGSGFLLLKVFPFMQASRRD